MVSGSIIYINLNDGAAVAGGSVVAQASTPENYDEIKADILAKFNASTDSFDPNREHILGNPDAPIKIIEFSDTECPFCKRFHPTLQNIMVEYGLDGKVAWIYKHMPLESLHAKAFREAKATECAYELGGNSGFWAYLDKIFEVTPSNDGLDVSQLPQIAQDIGLNSSKFEECLASGRHEERIRNDIALAEQKGATGTPFSVLVDPNGEEFDIRGALPHEVVKQAINKILDEN